MIELTRLNGHPLYVNCDLIKWAEAAPDTLLTLINGEKIVVRESCSEVVARMVDHRVRQLAGLSRFMHDPKTILEVAAAAGVLGPRAGGASRGRLSDSEKFEPDIDPGSDPGSGPDIEPG